MTNWFKDVVFAFCGKKRTNIEPIGSRERLRTVSEDAKYAHNLAKSRQSAEASVHYKKPSYEVGDEVWVSRKLFRDSYSKAQESAKLSARRFGPFQILELIGKNAIRLKFPDNIRSHSVVHVSHKKPHREQPVDIATKTPTTPISIRLEIDRRRRFHSFHSGGATSATNLALFSDSVTI